MCDMGHIERRVPHYFQCNDGVWGHSPGPTAIWCHLVAVVSSPPGSIGVTLRPLINGDWQDSSRNARNPLGLDQVGRILGTWLS